MWYLLCAMLFFRSPQKFVPMGSKRSKRCLRELAIEVCTVQGRLPRAALWEMPGQANFFSWKKSPELKKDVKMARLVKVRDNLNSTHEITTWRNILCNISQVGCGSRLNLTTILEDKQQDHILVRSYAYPYCSGWKKIRLHLRRNFPVTFWEEIGDSWGAVSKNSKLGSHLFCSRDFSPY